MKRSMFSLFLAGVMVLWSLGQLGNTMVYAQGMMQGHGMMGGCPMCGQSWAKIPEKLPVPNDAWIKDLKEVLFLEKLSLAQYNTDSGKFHVMMPYMMVIPQEENHIGWISQLFSTYGIAPEGTAPEIVKTVTVRQAYDIAIKLEMDLIPRYESLIRSAGDTDSSQVLNNILYQTRMHLMMFKHALGMGGMM